MHLRRRFFYSSADPVEMYRWRATQPGSLSVMWRNPAYNIQAERDQWDAIVRNVPERLDAVLDLGCGTGRLSGPLAKRFVRYVGIDIDAMVEEARRRNPGLHAEFVASKVQEYEFPPETYDLVLSVACVSVVCRADELAQVARRMVAATRCGGRIVMIEPFHRLPAITRECRIKPREVVELFTGLGTQVKEWSGLHFLPLRLPLARAWFSKFPGITRLGYKAGRTLGQLTPRFLSDYSVIVLTKV